MGFRDYGLFDFGWLEIFWDLAIFIYFLNLFLGLNKEHPPHAPTYSNLVRIWSVGPVAWFLSFQSKRSFYSSNTRKLDKFLRGLSSVSISVNMLIVFPFIMVWSILFLKYFLLRRCIDWQFFFLLIDWMHGTLGGWCRSARPVQAVQIQREFKPRPRDRFLPPRHQWAQWRDWASLGKNWS